MVLRPPSVRAKEFAHWEPPQPSIEELRRKLGAPSLGDDELLMRYVVGNEDVAAMRAEGVPRQPQSSANAHSRADPAQGLQPDLHSERRLIVDPGKAREPTVNSPSHGARTGREPKQ